MPSFKTTSPYKALRLKGLGVMEGWRRLKKGAEAELYLAQWLGLPVVIKRRVSKPYRRPDFDLQL
ncbi:MAG: hypothetical protein DRJ97_06720, partial [Thermoprotei archaeon]